MSDYPVKGRTFVDRRDAYKDATFTQVKPFVWLEDSDWYTIAIDKLTAKQVIWYGRVVPNAISTRPDAKETSQGWMILKRLPDDSVTYSKINIGKKYHTDTEYTKNTLDEYNRLLTLANNCLVSDVSHARNDWETLFFVIKDLNKHFNMTEEEVFEKLKMNYIKVRHYRLYLDRVEDGETETRKEKLERIHKLNQEGWE